MARLAPREPLAKARRSSGRAEEVPPPPPPPPEPGAGVSRVPLTGADTGIVGSAAGGPTGGSSPPKTASTPLSHRLRSSCSCFHCRAVSRRCCSLRASSLSRRTPVATSRSREASSVASAAATEALERNSWEKRAPEVGQRGVLPRGPRPGLALDHVGRRVTPLTEGVSRGVVEDDVFLDRTQVGHRLNSSAGVPGLLLRARAPDRPCGPDPRRHTDHPPRSGASGQ